MTRSVLCVVGLFFIGISIYVLQHPTGDLASFMDVSILAAKIRMAIGGLLIAYSLVDRIRQKIIRAAFVGAGMVALVITLLSFISIYMLAIDTFCLLSGGIFALVGGLELRTKHPVALPGILNRLPRPYTPWLNLNVPQTHRRSIA